MLTAPLFGAPDKGDIGRIGRCVEGMDQVQVAAIFEKFVRDHPQLWHQPLNISVFAAMDKACSGANDRNGR